eukprot:UN06775
MSGSNINEFGETILHGLVAEPLNQLNAKRKMKRGVQKLGVGRRKSVIVQQDGRNDQRPKSEVRNVLGHKAFVQRNSKVGMKEKQKSQKQRRNTTRRYGLSGNELYQRGDRRFDVTKTKSGRNINMMENR